jgi:predicted enzyme related to lactoylglutathione lyase
MIEGVATVSIFVNDQDKAKDFYLNKLGFELRQDTTMGELRWLAVAVKGATTEVILYKPDAHWQHYKDVVGKSQPVTFSVSDMDALHADLKAKGVRFVMEPERQPWGTQAIILDDEGNGLILVERAQG